MDLPDQYAVDQPPLPPIPLYSSSINYQPPPLSHSSLPPEIPSLPTPLPPPPVPTSTPGEVDTSVRQEEETQSTSLNSSDEKLAEDNFDSLQIVKSETGTEKLVS